MSILPGIRLDPRLADPLYRQLFDLVVDRIQTRTFPPGFRLPPTRALARELGTHRNTVVRAYEDLEAAGFVHSLVGRGTFVAPSSEQPSPPAPANGGRLPWASLLSRVSEVEALGRLDRVTGRTLGPPDAIVLNQLQPPPDLVPHDLFRRCMDHVLRTLGARALEYAPREGLARLRGLVAEDLARQGVPAAPEDVLITTGSQQALDLLVRSLISPGDPFLVEESTYSGVITLLATAGARIVPVPTDDEGPDLGALDRLRTIGARGFYTMPSGHNPTGARMSAARREALVAWSHDVCVPLVEDDYAADLHLDGTPPPALRALDGDVFYVGTFSKKLIPALRVGFLLCPRDLRSKLVPLKHAMDLGNSALLQHALAEFLERGYLRAHLQRTVPEYRRRRDALEAGLTEHVPHSIRWRQPPSGLALWLPLPPTLPQDATCDEARRGGVLVGHGALYGADARLHGIRLSYCSEPPERLVEGARRLGRALSRVEEWSRRDSSGAVGVV